VKRIETRDTVVLVMSRSEERALCQLSGEGAAALLERLAEHDRDALKAVRDVVRALNVQVAA
jgi:hypothetical protein